MSYTVCTFFWRKPSLSPQEFQDYMEKVHVPYMLELLGSAYPKTYKRYYIERDPSVPTYPATTLVGTHDETDFDAYGELTFDNEEAFKAFFLRMEHDPESAKKVRESDEKCMDLKKFKALKIQSSFVTMAPSKAMSDPRIDI